MKVLGGLVILALVVCQTSTQDYCDAELCTSGDPPTVKKHIDCNNSGEFGAACAGTGKEVNMADTNRNLILQNVNNYRNRVATGNLAGFETAARMPTVAWDIELARLAALSCKRCLPTRDACRNTDTFKRVGQIVSYQSKSTGNINYPQHLTTILQNWFLKYQNANSAKMASFTQDPPDYSHFAIMVNDHVTHMGCASCSWKEGGVLYLETICNWASQNAEGKPVYIAGDTASACTSGTNPTYPGLCNIGEDVDPNEYFP